MIFRSRVPHQSSGLSLVEYLARRFTYHSPAQWHGLVSAGRLAVNGQPVAADVAVAAGDEVAYTPEPFDEPEADLSFDVVFEDEWFLAIDKPGNLLVHRAGRSFTNNLVYQIRAGSRTAAFPNAAAVNRLDRETSGLVIIAKESSQCGAFAAALRSAQAHKEYLAVVHAGHGLRQGEINAPIGPDPSASMQYRHAVLEQGGKQALTLVLQVRPLGDRFALARLEPVTGRTHQLRLHCAHVGCPIVGDRLYGIDGEAKRDCAGLIGRQALHCAGMRFSHPFITRPVALSAPLPDDLTALLKRLST